MNQEHLAYLRTINFSDTPLHQIHFKTHRAYTTVLEHLQKGHGDQYLALIESEYPQVTFEQLKGFLLLNDKYGTPCKTIFTTQVHKLLYCSASTLRYAYHALRVLSYFKETALTDIVELGGGYGGLCLAIHYFAPILSADVAVHTYTIVDLPEVVPLAHAYLDAHRDNLPHMHYQCVPSTELDYRPQNAFFISNYCFTLIDDAYRARYAQQLLPACPHGFLVWQTAFGLPSQRAEECLGHPVLAVTEECPQTGPDHAKNYYVTF
jgi:putative sugar O-methyltransferase